MANLSRNNKFDFVGTLKYGKDVVVTRQLGSSKWSSTRANVMIQDGDNTQFLNVEYMHEPGMKTAVIFDKDGERQDIDLSMTNSKSVIENCADFMKTTIDLETDFEKKKEYVSLIFKKRNHEFKKEEDKTQEDFDKVVEYTKQIKEMATNRHEFAHMKDVIKFLEDNKELLDNKKVRVRGDVKTNYYNGSTTLKYVPSEIELVDEAFENQMRATTDFFFEKGCIEDDKKAKKVIVNGYICERIKKKDTLMPFNLVIDYGKLDLENEQHVGLLEFMKGTFDVKDKKQIHKIGLFLSIFSGRESAEFNEDMLTPQQKLNIKFGLATMEDYMPKGNVYGERTSEIKMISADYKTYKDGAVEVFPIKELCDYLVVEKEKSDSANTTQEEALSKDVNTEEDIMKLFS